MIKKHPNSETAESSSMSEEAAQPTSPLFIGARDQETPSYLVPKMREEPITPPVYYRELVMMHGDSDPGSAEEITGPIDFLHEDELSRPLPGKPVIGAILTYEQAWYERGLALGKLLHSTSLAPGEVTKIAVTHFDRVTAGHAREGADQTDSIESGTVAQSGVREVQAATSRDTQSGYSMQAGASYQANAGGSGGGLLYSASASVSASASMGVSMSSSQSKSDMAAYGARKVNQTTVAHSHAHRGRVATQVKEVSESEKQTARTRVLANYNHMHALNMLFFEVLQVYEVEAKVVDAERVIFIPGTSPKIDARFLETHREAVLEVMAEAGEPRFGRKLDDLLHHFSQLDLTAAEKVDQARQNLMQAIKDNHPEFLPSEAATLARDEYGWLDKALAEEKAAIQNHDAEMRILKVANGGSSKRLHGIYRNVSFSSHETDPIRRLKLLRETMKKELLWADQYAVDHGKYSSNPHFSMHAGGIERDISRVEKLKRIELSYELLQKSQKHEELSNEVQKTLQQVTSHRSQILQRVYARMSDEHFLRILANRKYGNEPLEGLVDPRPIAVHGHYIAFRFRHAKSRGDAKFSKAFTDHAKPGKRKEPIPKAKVTLPSGGVFGEAVLGQAVAAEKIDLTRFWNWKDSPIPILPPDIAATSMDSRAKGLKMHSAQLDSSAAQLMQPQQAAPIDLSTMAQEVSSHVRDMSGRDTLASTLAAQTQATKEGSIAAGQQSIDALRANQAFATNVLNSRAAQAAIAAMFPEAEGATVLGGLMGAGEGGAVGGGLGDAIEGLGEEAGGLDEPGGGGIAQPAEESGSEDPPATNEEKETSSENEGEGKKKTLTENSRGSRTRGLGDGASADGGDDPRRPVPKWGTGYTGGGMTHGVTSQAQDPANPPRNSTAGNMTVYVNGDWLLATGLSSSADGHEEDNAIWILNQMCAQGLIVAGSAIHIDLAVSSSPCTSTHRLAPRGTTRCAAGATLPITSTKDGEEGCTERLQNLATNGITVGDGHWTVTMNVFPTKLYCPQVATIKALQANAAVTGIDQGLILEASQQALEALKGTGGIHVSSDERTGAKQRFQAE